MQCQKRRKESEKENGIFTAMTLPKRRLTGNVVQKPSRGKRVDRRITGEPLFIFMHETPQCAYRTI